MNRTRWQLALQLHYVAPVSIPISSRESGPIGGQCADNREAN